MKKFKRISVVSVMSLLVVLTICFKMNIGVELNNQTLNITNKAPLSSSLTSRVGSLNTNTVSQNVAFKTTDFNDIANNDIFEEPKNSNDYVNDEIIVKYKDSKINLSTSSGMEKSKNFASSKSISKKEDLISSNISVFKIIDGSSVYDKVAEIESDPNVEYAEPNYRRYIENNIGTNDTYGDNLWGLENVGQTVNSVTGTNDDDIDIKNAWLSGKGSGFIVAVIDTGVAYNHPDLINQMWDGTSCKDYNGNALGSCNHGYDYEDNDKTPLPTSSSHGTHVSGTIAAESNNALGISGVAPLSKIMALKFGLDTVGEVKAIDFAIQNGAKVINASYGGGSFSQSEYDAINRFKTAGGIFVAAAGNGGSDGVGDNNDSNLFYPASYNLDNIISVAATNQNSALASFSNYGHTTVDVGAPGVNIYSSVADTNVLSENFDINIPNIPSGWTKGGVNNNWGTYQSGANAYGVLYSDLATPYANNANTNIVSSAYDIDSNSATIDFWTRCDTQYTAFADYMALDFSGDGGNTFTEIAKWDEVSIDILNGNSSPTGGAVYNIVETIPEQYLTSNFKFRFRWVTDGSDNNYDGCLIDKVVITKFSDGSDEKYDFYNGTSMATPHVVGLVALLKGRNPNMTLSDAKNFIINYGNNIVNSASSTVSNSTINAGMSMVVSSTYTVTYDANGGTCTPTSRVVYRNATSLAPSCSRTGYTLTGFTRTVGSSGSLNATTGEVTDVYGNQTIQANWLINTYTVTYDANGGTCTPTSRSVNYNTTAVAPSCLRTGYTLSGFTRTSGSGGILNTSTGEITSVTGIQTIRANWTINTYTVTYSANGGTCTPTSRSVQYSSTSLAPSCSRTGYTLTGFTRTVGSGGGLNTSTGEVTSVSGDQTIQANWLAITYTVTYNANGGTCTPSNRVVNSGTTASAPSCTKTGYELIGFTRTSGSGGTLNASTGEVTNVTGTQTIQASWSGNSYTVSYDANGGTCTPVNRNVSIGANSASPTCSRTGYTLTGFTRTSGLGGELNESTGEVTNVSGDQTIQATWSAITFTVTYDANGGICDPTDRTVNYGATALYPSCVRTGYTLTGFTRTSGSGGSLNTSNGEVTGVTGNQTIQASWIEDEPVVSGDNLYQSHVGTDGKIYNRSSTDGISWTEWTREMFNAPGESTAIPITMTSMGSTIYQSHVGTDGKVYNRSSTNGINWTRWSREMTNAPGEDTKIPITMTSMGSSVYQSHVGTDGKVYNRSSTDGIYWTTWTREMVNAPGEDTKIPITMTSMGSSVYQSHVGTDGKVYNRSSFDGISWTAWTREMTNAPGESTKIPITMTSMGTNVYQSHVGTDGKVYNRSSENGINWTAWTREMFNAPGESTAIPITMTSMGSSVYQSHVGTDGKVYNRSSANGINWTTWTREMTNAPGESTRIPITMTSVNVTE